MNLSKQYVIIFNNYKANGMKDVTPKSSRLELIGAINHIKYLIRYCRNETTRTELAKIGLEFNAKLLDGKF